MFRDRAQDRGRSPLPGSAPEYHDHVPKVIVRNTFLTVEGFTIGFKDEVHCSRRSASCPPSYVSVDDPFVAHASIETPVSIVSPISDAIPDSEVTSASVPDLVSLDTPLSVEPLDSTPVTGTTQ